METRQKKIIAVLGATGTGKSKFSIEIAKRIRGEIISCDSMAVYKGVDIATDKVPLEEREGIPHHLYDVADIGDFFLAGLFRKMALARIEEIIERGRIPVLVGGTGLYARALFSGMAEAPSRNEEIRKRLKFIAEEKGINHLYKILKKLDNQRANSIAPNDKVRIIRALELRILTGKKFSEITQSNKAISDEYKVMKICLNYPREVLYKRIEERVDKMVQRGLIEEVRILYNSRRLNGPLSKAIGIKELIPCFEKNKRFEDAIEEIKQHTRNLAKRQLTWFKKEIGLKWVVMDDDYERAKVIGEIEKWSRGEENEQ
ncbi:MAG: tRNA (adenosine(37)-N6)-dimethylallyltransferase MiaA [Acidobacteria bacterium]|nr:tRNA (adenosine(37)-N6)-dimethylallyltransferase MiaA [Acidobacteriota bacterium]